MPHTSLILSKRKMTLANSKLIWQLLLQVDGWFICKEEMLNSRFGEYVITEFRFDNELCFEKPNIQRIGLGLVSEEILLSQQQPLHP